MKLKDLMYDALIMAKKNNFDVFNALDLMEVSYNNREEREGVWRMRRMASAVWSEGEREGARER